MCVHRIKLGSRKARKKNDVSSENSIRVKFVEENSSAMD